MRLFLVKAREPIPISTRWPLEPTLGEGPGAFHLWSPLLIPRSLSIAIRHSRESAPRIVETLSFVPYGFPPARE